MSCHLNNMILDWREHGHCILLVHNLCMKWASSFRLVWYALLIYHFWRPKETKEKVWPLREEIWFISMKKRYKWITELYDRRSLRRCEHIDFDVEAWYPILQCQIFYTEFIPISPSIAQAFANYYQTRYNSKNLLSLNDLQVIQSI
jgi:hypothetical protein